MSTNYESIHSASEDGPLKAVGEQERDTRAQAKQPLEAFQLLTCKELSGLILYPFARVERMNCQHRARKLRLSLSVVTLLATYNQIFAAPLNLLSMETYHWGKHLPGKFNLTCDEIVAPLNKARIPFSSTHGNHDNQANITHERRSYRCWRIEGPGNYWVPIYRNENGPIFSLHLQVSYLCPLDHAPALSSGSLTPRLFPDFPTGGFSPNPDSEPVPDWVDETVAGWIETETQAMEEAWGPAESRGAVALCNTAVLQSTLDPTKNPGLNADTLGDGSVQDSTEAYTPKIKHFGMRSMPMSRISTQSFLAMTTVTNGALVNPLRCHLLLRQAFRLWRIQRCELGSWSEESRLHTPDPTAGVETWIRLQAGERERGLCLMEL
ncbi:hypothetical protein BJ912DRAFT_1105424 [Pholiota molesta]|nr:hypothetical protein BJ912DRAFT_1105424 [Pholiota molesta]